MTSFERHLQAAWGYLELGMPHDANGEVNLIAPDQRAQVRVVQARVEIFQALGKWRAMEACAHALCQAAPGAVEGWISLARARRGARSLKSARNVLLDVASLFPREAKVAYELARYEAQLGNLAPARKYLRRAIRTDKSCRAAAMNEPDLSALHGELRQKRFVQPFLPGI